MRSGHSHDLSGTLFLNKTKANLDSTTYHTRRATTSTRRRLLSLGCSHESIRSELTTADKPNPTAELKALARTASPSLIVIRGTASS